MVHDLHNLDGCINTFSGKKFNLLKPTADMVAVADIARGLGFNSHFGGQVPAFFSIAQHSVMVMNVCKEPELKLVALLHDAAEAYIGDMLKPLKIHLPYFNAVEAGIQCAVFEKFGLNVDDLPEIKKYDREIQELEFNVFFRGFRSGNFQYWPPEKSVYEFNMAFHSLTNNRYNG